MRRAWLAAFFSLSPALAAAEAPTRFRPVDVFIETPRPLAAYQVELVAPEGAQIVGVEGGEHPAFAEAPFYDPKALMGGRIILAAFSTGDDLPTGRFRALTVHVREAGEVSGYEVKLMAAADAEGHAIDVRLEARPRKDEE